MPMFVTLYFSFPDKGIQYNTLVFSKNVGANCAYSSSLEINGIKFNTWAKMEEGFYLLIIISQIHKN